MPDPRPDIIEQLEKIRNAKNGIKTALEGAGVAVPSAFLDYGGVLEATIKPILDCIVSINNNDVRFSAPIRTLSLPRMSSATANYAFYGNEYLETVDLPLVKSIKSASFGACVNLESLNIPKVETIVSNTFGVQADFTEGHTDKQLSKLVSLTLPAITTINKKAFGYTNTQEGNRVYYFTGIVDLYIPNKTRSEIEAMSDYGLWGLSPDCTIHAKPESASTLSSKKSSKRKKASVEWDDFKYEPSAELPDDYDSDYSENEIN